MKISFLDDEPEIFPMQYGGKARTIIALAKQFTKIKDIENVTVLSRTINTKRKKFRWNGINFHKLEGYDIIKKIIEESSSTDVLNVHASSFTFPYIKNKKAVLVNHLHDVIFATSDTGSHLDKAIGGQWDAIISPSIFATRVLKNIISSWSDVDRKIFTIARAIDTKTFYSVSSKIAYSKIKNFSNNVEIKSNTYPIIFFPHRVNANKGEVFLPGLCKLISNKYPNSLILATFDGNLNFKIPNLINLRWVPTKYMKYFYSISDLTISMSLSPESFSQVCLESIACNTPVLCFKFGNMSDLSEKFPAIISCKPEVKKIFSGIVYILENTKKIKKKIILSKKILKKEYNIKKISRTYISVYKNIIKDKQTKKVESANTCNRKYNTEYFASPVIADYGLVVYSCEGGGLQKFKLSKLEQKVLSSCKEAKTLKEIKMSPQQSKKIINKLVKLKLMIKS